MCWCKEIRRTTFNNGRYDAISLFRQLAASDNVQAVVVKEINAYRAYEKSAEKLCELLNVEPYYNASGVIGLRITKASDNNIRSLLKQKKINFAIKNNDIVEVYLYSAHSDDLPVLPKPSKTESAVTLPADTRKVAKLNDCVELMDISYEEVLKVYLAGEEKYSTLCVDTGREKQIIHVPITEIGKYRILTSETELSKSIIGKHEGEQFVLKGNGYKILRIFNDDELKVV